MRKIQLSQNNETFICICDSSCLRSKDELIKRYFW